MPNIPVAWRAQQTVNTVTANLQLDPDIIHLANGNILVCWTSSDDTGAGSAAGLDVIGQIFDPLGNRIGGEIKLNGSFFVDNEQDMDMAALPGGGFLVVYEDTDAGSTSLRLNEYDATGAAVSDNATVVSDVAGDPAYRNPRVAVSSATSALIVYEEVTAGVAGIYGKIYDSTTNTYGAQFAIITGGATGGTQNADVAVLTNGNYVVAADRGDADNSLVYRIFTSTGGLVLGATFVSGTDSNGENDREATVTALTGGGFVIAWTNTDTNDTDIEYRVYNAAGTQTASGFAGFNTGDLTNLNNEPVVAGLADGSFVIVMDNDELNRLDVAHISAAGASLGNFNFAGAASFPAVIGLDDGRFAVTWNDSAGEISMEILDTRDTPNSLSVYTPFTRVGTIGDDTTNFGSGLSQRLYGWDGNDVIDGLAGADTIYGGAGNDTIYFDAADGLTNAFGEAGTDILFAVSGQNPFGFNLAAQGFEQGLIYYSDGANAQPWTTSYQYYRPGWVVDYQDTNYDNGTRQVQYSDYAAANTWSQYTDYYNNASLLEARQTIYDDGRIENQFFDLPPNDPFASYIDYYTVGGQLEARRTINDDASYQTTYFDLAANPWSRYTDFINVGGQLVARQTFNDDNSFTNTYFDPAPPNANPWAQYTDYFNAAGVFIGRTGVNDDGTLF